MFIAYIILYYFLVIVISQQGDNTYVEYLTRQFQRLLGMVTSDEAVKQTVIDAVNAGM